MKKYLLVIDTNSYSGNFEREMCAYVAGALGECGVGEEEALIYKEKESFVFDELLRYESDEGCNRPVAIWETPGFFNDGYGRHYKNGEEEQAEKNLQKNKVYKHPAYQSVAIFFEERPGNEAIDLIKRRAEEFTKHYENHWKNSSKNRIKILSIRFY